MHRSAAMAREKRGLDRSSDWDEQQPEQKRHKIPALASVIVEALKVDSLQKLCSSLEPILRRVVSEEVERALAKLGPARLGGRSSPKPIEGPDGRSLQLHFRSRLSLPLFTGGKVEGEQGAAIHVVLLDASTGHVITSGSESSSKLDIVVLEGDFDNEDDDDWTEDDFESHVVREREGKRPLLTGDLQVSLKEGVGTIGELTFTDNSSWIRSRKFRLGLKMAPGFCDGIRIREAKTEAFTVKDHRGELYKKHYPPALKDEVWRLEKIGKDGAFHKRLNKAGIYIVEDFLRLVVRDAQKLRNVLGSGMSNKMWESLVDHAKTCVLSGKYYVYYSDDTRSIGAVFNNIYEFSGLIFEGQYYSAECLIDSQKIFADALVKRAYENWMHVIEYDGKSFMNTNQSKETNASCSEPISAPSIYPQSYEGQVSEQFVSTQVPIEHQSLDSEVADRGSKILSVYNERHETQYPTRLQHPSSNVTPYAVMGNHYSGSSHHSQVTRNDSTGLALGPPQQSSTGFESSGQLIQATGLNSYDDWARPRADDDFLSEDEIRMRSHEMLENEDMQHLLRVFNMGGTPAILPEDDCSFPYIPTPNYNYDEDHSRSSRKAVHGWLKIKAAMRWGIFIRKKAAERRAQLIELDD